MIDVKSTTSYAFMIANGCNSFDSHKQSIVTFSVMEREYISLIDATKEAMFLSRLLDSLKFDIISIVS